MNIYALRDRLIDYYLTPFAAPTDKDVLAAIAAAINNGENRDAIAQAPHHFEIWKLATIDDDGHIKEARELLADCASLIRTDLRKSSPELTRAGESGDPIGQSQGTT